MSSLPSQYGALSSRNSLVSGFVTLIQLLYGRGNINIFSKYKTNVPRYMVLEVHWDTIIAISVPVVTAVYLITRHIWKSTKKIDIHEMQINALNDLAEQGRKDHIKIFIEISDIKERVSAMEAKLDIILAKIK